MCTVVDGYKLYLVITEAGELADVAGVGPDDALARALARGITRPVAVRWHPRYRAYAAEFSEVRREQMRQELEDIIIEDVANHE